MPGLLDSPPLDLAQATRRLHDLRSRGRQLLALALTLALAGVALAARGGGAAGVPLLIGSAGALALVGLGRGDRRRLLVALVAQGDAWALKDVRDLAERLSGPRERRRLAHGLRAAAAVAAGAQLSMMVNPARVDVVRDRLNALAERFGDPLTKVSATAAAICRRMLCDAQHSPLYNPHVPEGDLGRILDLLERDLALPS
ncbi:MAG: hypothetical protein WCB67_08125 [Solirubrobacteraceae bacterium]